MSRGLATLTVVALVLLAGCTFGTSGSDGDAADGDTPTPTPDPEADIGGTMDAGTTTATGPSAVDSTGTTATARAPGTETPVTARGERPHVTDGSLDVRALVRTHVDVLSRTGSFLLTNNGTVHSVGNESLLGRIVSVRAVDFADQRRYALQRGMGPDGAVRSASERFENASTTCTRFDGSVDCGSSGFDRGRALGEVVEVTSLETVGGPDFVANGTDRRNGRELYRYTATSFRSSLSESIRSELGSNPSLDRATLLVAPNGRIVEYRIVYDHDQSTGPRAHIDRTYRTLGVNSTTVPPPPWLAS